MGLGILWAVPQNLEKFLLRLHSSALASMDKGKVIVRSYECGLRRNGSSIRIGRFREHVVFLRYPASEVPGVGMFVVELEQPSYRLSRHAVVSMRLIEQRKTIEGLTVAWMSD